MTPRWYLERPAYDEKVFADLSQSASLGSVMPEGLVPVDVAMVLM